MTFSTTVIAGGITVHLLVMIGSIWTTYLVSVSHNLGPLFDNLVFGHTLKLVVKLDCINLHGIGITEG